MQYLILALALLSSLSGVRAASYNTSSAADACRAYFAEWASSADLLGLGPEPLSPCQWGHRMIGADSLPARAPTGKGVRIGIMGWGVDWTHPDLKDRVDLNASCSFLRQDDQNSSLPWEIANGNCSNKEALMDAIGSDTFTASIIAASKNGIGMMGVAPEATIVILKVCGSSGFMCWGDVVAKALRYAGDIGLDIIYFTEPSLVDSTFGSVYWCASDPQQKSALAEIQTAATYAMSKGALIVTGAAWTFPGPENMPIGTRPANRTGKCRLPLSSLPNAVVVSGVGQYQTLSSGSAIGPLVSVTAPSGDWGQTPGGSANGGSTTFGRILGAWGGLDVYGQWNRLAAGTEGRDLRTVMDDKGNKWLWLSSVHSPHAVGVAALIKQRHPKWGAWKLARWLRATSTYLPCFTDREGSTAEGCVLHNATNTTTSTGRNWFYGYGLINATAAVKA